MPTRVLAGKNCVQANALALKELGQKALVVTGARSAKINGAQDDVLRALEANGQRYTVFDKVMSNPTVQCVYDGAALAQREGCDCVIAIGGGSPMDAAKVMALLAAQGKEIPEDALFVTAYTRTLPLAAVPTTAGSGSEVTQYAILTNDITETKTSIATALNFPKLALLDAKYLEKVSKTTAINTALDALSHSIEGMLSVRASHVSDVLAKESIALIAGCFGMLQKKQLPAETREKLLLASTLGGMVIANTGTTAVHTMGYSLTYYKNIDHGRANALLLPAFLSFVKKREKRRIAEILACIGMTTTQEFSDAVNTLLGNRETLTLEEIEHYAEKAAKAASIGNCLIRLETSDLVEVLKKSML